MPSKPGDARYAGRVSIGASAEVTSAEHSGPPSFIGSLRWAGRFANRAPGSYVSPPAASARCRRGFPPETGGNIGQFRGDCLAKSSTYVGQINGGSKIGLILRKAPTVIIEKPRAGVIQARG